LRQTIQTDVNALRRQQAMPLVEQLQWVAGAAAFANPVPTLDLLATVAINGQLIMDLGKVYGFNLSLEEAKTAAGTLASLTVKLGLVELTSQLLTTDPQEPLCHLCRRGGDPGDECRLPDPHGRYQPD
jgi:hypothetical protein